MSALTGAANSEVLGCFFFLFSLFGSRLMVLFLVYLPFSHLRHWPVDISVALVGEHLFQNGICRVSPAIYVKQSLLYTIYRWFV